MSAQNATPIRILAASGKINGRSFVISGYILEAYVVACTREADTAAQHPRIRPAERSVPASTIIPATPSARIPLVDAWVKILIKFDGCKNPGSMMMTTMIINPKIMYNA